MKIGALSTATQTPVETIRFYEREGLLPSTARTEANYRIYTPEHVLRLAFIRQCRSLDMTLDEVRVLLRVKDQPSGDCSEVTTLLEAHIGHVKQRIRALHSLKKELLALRAACGTPQDVAGCGILNGIGGVELSASDRVIRRHVRGAH